MMKYNKDEVLNTLHVGIENGKKAYKIKKSINHSLIIFLILFSSFSISVNMSDAFASSLIDVPVIGEIVKLVRIGSGFEEVAKQGLYTEGEVLLRNEDYIVKIEGYYYSDFDINIFIGIEGNFEPEFIYDITEVTITDPSGSKVEEYSLRYGTINIDDNYANAEISLKKKKGELPEKIDIQFSVIRTKQSQDHSKTDSNTQKEYIIKNLKADLTKQIPKADITKVINEAYEIDGMTINLKNLLITPTTMNLEVSIDSTVMNFYGFDSIQFSNGEKIFPLISNGIYATGDQNVGYTYYFESCYFDDIDNIKLEINGIMALPKDNSTIIIDLENKEILKSIDNKIKLSHFVEREDSYDVYLESDKKFDFNFKQYNEQPFESVGYMSDEKVNTYILEVKDEHVTNGIIEISFWQYPNVIEFKENLHIKLN